MFFYWKTSASLWKTKLSELPASGKVLVPINWAFHTETGSTFDFAQDRPETNLARLAEIANELGIEVVFLVPTTPAPFLPNGGVPSILSRYQAQDTRGVTRAIISFEEKMNKVTSFFDPRVFQGYSFFMKALGTYIRESGIAGDVYGMRCGTMEDGRFQSLLYDTSRSFEMAFERFVETKKRTAFQEGESFEIKDGIEEAALKEKFVRTIDSLYSETLSESLAGNWEGQVNFSFLGSSLLDFFNRLNENEDSLRYSLDIFSSISMDVIPSSVLLPPRIKKGVLKKQLEELVSQSLLTEKFQSSRYENENVSQFTPLAFFEVFEESSMLETGERPWKEVGLWDYLGDLYRWAYKVCDASTYEWNQDEVLSSRILIFSGKMVTAKYFRSLLNTFMSGGRIILDRSSLTQDYLKKFETFFLENSLKVEKVFLHTNVHDIRLGEGRLVIYEGDSLKQKSDSDKKQFWTRLIDTFDIAHIRESFSKEMEVFWRTRAPNSSELKFEEVRRLNLYNPTSYRSYARIKPTKNFVLTKRVEEINAKINVHHGEIEVELMPDGVLSLDFGVYS